MNYRHTFHAGNFADVFKHIILVALTKSFLRKDSAFCYQDTHAGIGVYNLFTPPANINKEYISGIGKLRHAKNPPELITDFLTCVQNVNKPNDTRFYPGSPSIVKQYLRPQDRMLLTELQAQDYQTLKKRFLNDKQVQLKREDGYQALKAYLPPKEKRGLVLIDPPYEDANELSRMPAVIEEALSRFETGVYALWYPIKDRPPVERFYRRLKEKVSQPMLVCELSIHPENLPTHLNGSGMLIVNPPWQLDEQIKEILPWLWKVLSIDSQGQYTLRML